MSIKSLSMSERQHLIAVVQEALRVSGGDELGLFATPLSYIEEEGKIKFDFPDWMLSIRQFLLASHDEQSTRDLMLDIMFELMKPDGIKKLLSVDCMTAQSA